MAEPETATAGEPEDGAGPQPVWVQMLEAKPNKMFTEEQRQLVLFLRYSQPVPCAECGKRSKHHWTFIVSFKALTMPKNACVIPEPDTVHLPMAPVCRAHLLKPAALPHAAPKRARRTAMPRGRHTGLRVGLTPEQRRTLERWQRTPTLPAALVRRGRLLLLVAAGTPLTEAAGKVGMSRRYVYKWVERFRTEGLGGLADRPRHAPAVRAED